MAAPSVHHDWLHAKQAGVCGWTRRVPAALRFLASLRASSARFRDAALALRGHEQVKEVRSEFRVPAYVTPCVEAYVEIEAANGRAYVWSLMVTAHPGEWEIDTDVEAIGPSSVDEHERLIAFPERRARTGEELLAALAEATDALLATTSAFDFSPAPQS